MSEPAPDPRSLRMNAALDGELDAANVLAFERDLANDPAFAAEYRELEAVRDSVRRHAAREAAPQSLVASVMALAGAAPEKPTNVIPLTPRRALSSWRQGLPLAASFAVLGFAAGAGLMSLSPPNAPGRIADGLVSDFSRAALAGQPFDVASSDRHTVKPWLSGRTTVSADIVDLAAQDFPLAGGRVAIVDRIPSPTLVYRHNEHMVAVTEVPLDAAGARGEGLSTVDGYHVARWTDARLAYVAVSDMDEKTLAEFVSIFRSAHAAPPGEGGSPK